MMTCPKCGNRNAECIIGNFYRCPGCDGSTVVTGRKTGATIFDRIAWTVAKLWPQNRINMYASHRIAPVVVVGAIPINELQQAKANWWRVELEGRYIQRHLHDASGFVRYVDEVVDAALDTVLGELRQMTAGARKVETWDGFPHWVTDDGQIMVRQDLNADGFEIRLRAFWRAA